jgi:hypothetical protein
MKVIFKCKGRIYHYCNLDVMLKCVFLCLFSHYSNVDLRIFFFLFFEFLVTILVYLLYLSPYCRYNNVVVTSYDYNFSLELFLSFETTLYILR